MRFIVNSSFAIFSLISLLFEMVVLFIPLNVSAVPPSIFPEMLPNVQAGHGEKGSNAARFACISSVLVLN